MIDNPSIRRAYAAAASRDPGETGFLQTLSSLYESLAPCLEEQPQYASGSLLERLGEPERAVTFPIVWTDGTGSERQARGFFIQYSTVLGPCRGPLVFRRGLDMAAAKALALSSTLESSLAGLALGGGLYGADVSPVGWRNEESLRFCQGFMERLYSLLPRAFRPADWAGQVPRRELDYLTGQYQRLGASVTGWADGGQTQPGPMTRPQAVGHGLCCFAQHAMRRLGGSGLEGQTVLVSGLDGPAPWAAEKAARMGAQVIAIGDGSGCLFAPDGLSLALLQDMASQPGLPPLLWAIRSRGVEYRPGPGLWEIAADVVFLCDDRTRLDVEVARQIVAHRPMGIFEGVARACTAMAERVFDRGEALYSPAIASGAGGSVMAQRQRDRVLTQWEADRQLRAAMSGIFRTVWEQSVRSCHPGGLLQAARIAAFRPIADAILAKGL